MTDRINIMNQSNTLLSPVNYYQTPVNKNLRFVCTTVVYLFSKTIFGNRPEQLSRIIRDLL